MKRYTPPYVDWMQEGAMPENENGPYVKYEDMLGILNLIIKYSSDISRKHILDILHKEEIE